jgi:hypothetical protein
VDQTSTNPNTQSAAVMGTSGPGLGFALANAMGAPVVYITADPSINTLTLTITNQTGKALTLKGGAPVPEGEITSAGPTSLYLTLGDLLTTDQFKAMQISAPGWQVQLMSGDITNWALTPQTDQALADKSSVTVTITHLTVSGQPRPGKLTLDYYNVPTVPDDSWQQTLIVQTPPSQPHDLALDVEFMGGHDVYVSQDSANPILNTLILSIANPSPATPLVPTNVPWGANAPVFFLSFVYGTNHGYGALTTTSLGQTIEVAPIGQTADTWAAEKVESQGGPYWRLTPQQHEVLGTQAGGRVGFTISHIITEFDPETLPTSLYLQWANVPGYNDGYTSLGIVKALPTPGILSFLSLTPEIVPAGTPVSLAWQTFGIARVTLSYVVKQQAVTFDSDTGAIATSMARFAPTPLPVLTTTYSLDAFDASRAKVDAKQINLTVIEPPIKIESFTASPLRANFAAGPVDITLTWSVTPPDMVKRLEIAGPGIVPGQGIVTGQPSYVVRSVKEPTTYTLCATGRADDEQTASVQTQVLKDYLVGRTYEVSTPTVSGQIAVDRLEFVSSSAASYTGGFLSRYEPFFDYGVTGPWSLVGTTIHVVTSLGTLLFDYQEHTAKGEALKFENSPLEKSFGTGYDPLLTPQ